VQIDELDLAWEDEADKGRHRRRAARERARAEAAGEPPRRRKKGRGGRTIAALLISLVVLGGVAFGGWYGIDRIKAFFTTPDYTTGGSGDVQVQVLTGQTATDIGQTLFKADVVKSAKAFVEAAKSNPRSTSLQPGFYKLRHKMRASDALSLMLDPQSKLVTKVTLPEGLTYQETFAKLSAATKIPVADFEKAAADPVALGVSDVWFNRTDGKAVKKSIEGFLYPSTYSFDPGVDATAVLKAIVQNFNDEMTKADFINQAQTKLHISPYEALIAASIEQVEGVFPDDQAKIARVLYNRAYSGKFPCSCLQLDSTVNYWLKISGKSAKPSQDLLNSELHDRNDPYNTHDVAGMPLGPISNPGDSAIQGAINPPTDLPAKNYLFFVAIDKAGHTAFGVTDAEQEHNKQIARQNGVL
jgi:UPF0755 protein